MMVSMATSLWFSMSSSHLATAVFATALVSSTKSGTGSTSTASNSSSLSTGAWVGIVLGGIAFVVACTWLYRLLRLYFYYSTSDANRPN
jgi:hypothetical protein